ncbi:MAG: hypothetical protein C4531_07160 [Desulfurivibrio sp.]|nr:MAG: hypothetical protein C4531_07160 [Desulfurivibrio sp.]
MGAQEWGNTCGVCHVGGGQLEYNRDLQAYGSAGEGGGDAYVLKYARPDDPGTALDETSWDNVTVGNMSATNKAEMDCLMCHLDGSNPGSAWLKTLDCGPGNAIGPANDPTCSGTSMIPGLRTVSNAPGVNEYDMFNRNFGLKQRRMDLIASMGAGAKGIFDANDQLSGVDWGAGAVEQTDPADAAYIGQHVSEATREGIAGCVDYSYQGSLINPATGNTYNADGIPYLVNAINPCVKLNGAKVAATPKSENCSVCHARDDQTMGLPGMMAMRTGYGNYGLIHDPSNPMPSGNMGASRDLDTDNGAGAVNDDYWFDFGCKTGMGKRAHKITAENDDYGVNARWGMSMFAPSTLDMDPATTPNAGDPIPGKMPDIDVHDRNGMECASCHYAVGSTTGTGYEDIPAKEVHGYEYPAERIYAMDHQFAQADSFPDTKGKNNLDAKIRCDGCHTVRDNPKLVENGGTLVAPMPLHNGLPQLHIDRIGCVTCHVPETYSAPGRLKYRDWTAGFARGTFRNTLDWNFDLVTGSHNTVPSLRKWVTKNGERKIYPVLPSLLPTWFEMVPNSGVLVQDDANMLGTDPDALLGDNSNILDEHAAAFASPIKNRDLQKVAEYVRDNHPEFDMRLNGGNTVPLFDGFQIVDSWEIDTEAEINAMLDGFNGRVNGSDARFVKFLNVIQADFDVTHGVVPKDWALGGSARGGCVSCHSSMNAASPNYSPYSVGFFEGYVQPVANAGLPGFGVGGYEIVKNWMAMFADFDAAAMCGAGDPTKTAADGMNGMINPNTDHHNFYFNPMTGQPNMTAECASWSWFSNNPMFGTSGGNAQLQHVIGMMTATFDQAMGFPGSTTCDAVGAADGVCDDGSGRTCSADADCGSTASRMGMYDGVAGIQGFALKELQTAGTLGCNPFAGPASFSPAPDMNGDSKADQTVNNCLPNYADPAVAAAIDGMMGAGSAAQYAGMINGTCAGAAAPNPGACTGGFRNGGACMTNDDCAGAMTDMAEIGHNPFGLMLGRAEAVSHFKIDLQQSYNADGSPKVKWAVGGEQNPSNPSHVASWDQAAYCYDYMGGPNPMTPAVVPCNSAEATRMDGRRHIATAQSANQYLGYTAQTLALLMNPGTAQADKTYVVDANFSGLPSADTDLTVTYDASRASCYKKDPATSVITQMTCTYDWDTTGGTVVGGNGSSQVVVLYPAAGAYTAGLTMTMADDPATLGDESSVSDSQSVTVNAVVVEPPVPVVDFATSVAGKVVTLTAPTLDPGVVRAYIYWGDRTRTVVTNVASLAAGINHTYSRGGRSYNIIVEVIDVKHVKTSFTSSVDADLSVTLP